MPYYVYHVKPFAQLERLGEHAAFKDASAMAKAERSRLAASSAGATGTHLTQVRVMFAASAEQAEDLLLQVRDAPAPGDE